MVTIEQLQEELHDVQNMLQKINDEIEEVKSYINYDYVAYDTRITKIIAFRRSEFSKIKKIFSFNDTFSMINSIDHKNIDDILKMDVIEIYLADDDIKKIIFNYISNKFDIKKNINKHIEELQDQINNYNKYLDYEKLVEDYKKQCKYFDCLTGERIYSFIDGGFYTNNCKANPTVISNILNRTLYIYGMRCCSFDFNNNILVFYEMKHSTTVTKYINKFIEDMGIDKKFCNFKHGDELKTKYSSWRVYFYHNYEYGDELKPEDIIPEVMEHINK